MDIKNFLGSFFTCREINAETYLVTTPFVMVANIPFEFMVQKTDNVWKITDQRTTLALLSKIYVLNAPDVKGCLSEVFKLNRVKIHKAEIYVTFEDEKSFKSQLANFLMAISQLLRMQAFFDKD